MEQRKKYNSILVFDSLLTIGEDKVYGFVYDNKECSAESNHYWVEYMVGCKKWIESGNTTDKDDSYSWVEKDTGLRYACHSEFADEYCKQAYMENPIIYFSKEDFTFNFAEEDIDGTYIIGEKFWNWALNQMDELFSYEEAVAACLPEQEEADDADSDNDDLTF